MKIALEKVEPAQIEKRSFEIIGEELGERSFPKLHEPIIKRCIHTSADFDYADNLVFSEHAVEAALAALKRGEAIITIALWQRKTWRLRPRSEKRHVR